MRIHLRAIDPEPVSHRQTGIVENMLHENLILTDCGPIQIAACIRHFQHFKETLNGAVFTIGAMHHRDGDINRAKILRSEHRMLDRQNLYLIVYIGKHDLCALGHKGIQVTEIADVIQQIRHIQLSVFGNINRNHIVFFRVQGSHGLMAGNHGDFMLDGLAAEEDTNIQFHSQNLRKILYPELHILQDGIRNEGTGC